MHPLTCYDSLAPRSDAGSTNNLLTVERAVVLGPCVSARQVHEDTVGSGDPCPCQGDWVPTKQAQASRLPATTSRPPLTRRPVRRRRSSYRSGVSDIRRRTPPRTVPPGPGPHGVRLHIAGRPGVGCPASGVIAGVGRGLLHSVPHVADERRQERRSVPAQRMATCMETACWASTKPDSYSVQSRPRTASAGIGSHLLSAWPRRRCCHNSSRQCRASGVGTTGLVAIPPLEYLDQRGWSGRATVPTGDHLLRLDSPSNPLSPQAKWVCPVNGRIVPAKQRGQRNPLCYWLIVPCCRTLTAPVCTPIFP